jgi:hypothetical protein
MSDSADIKRKKYRTPKWRETNVAAYTIAQESKYLIASDVPALGLEKELLKSFALYGEIEEYRHMDDQGDKFNDVYWIKFKSIVAARLAKAKLNKSSFFSNELKVKYAPEFETIEDTREKIEERRSTILFKVQNADKFYSTAPRKKNPMEAWTASENAQHYQFTTDPTTGEQMVSLKPEYNPHAQGIPPPPQQPQPSIGYTNYNNTDMPPPPPKPHQSIPPPPVKQPNRISNIPPPPPAKQPTTHQNIPPPPPKEKQGEKADDRRGVKRQSHEDLVNKYGGSLSKEFPPNDSVGNSVMSIRSKLKKTNRIILPPSVMAQLNEQPAPNKKSEDNNYEHPNKRRKLDHNTKS